MLPKDNAGPLINSGTEQRHGNKRHLRQTDWKGEEVYCTQRENERMDRMRMCPRKTEREEEEGSYGLKAERNCHPPNCSGGRSHHHSAGFMVWLIPSPPFGLIACDRGRLHV